MFATIRRYKTDFPDEVNRRVREDFVPLIKKQPGFVAYHGIDAGDGHWVSVSIFETEAGAEKSNAIAKEWVKNNIAAFQNILDFDDSDLLIPDITGGEVIASTVSKAAKRVA